MKKRGFTLAEVMVALALIGVVASLTIPTFVGSSRNKANAAKLATVVSAVENAFTTMMVAEAQPNLAGTDFYNDNDINFDRLGVYLKIAGVSEYNSAAYNVTGGTVSISNSQGVVRLKNGADVIFVDSVPGAGGADLSPFELIIDVNGIGSRPNVWGRDVFCFRVAGADGGLYPIGSERYDELSGGTNTAASQCVIGTTGEFCTARLVENNYEVDF